MAGEEKIMDAKTIAIVGLSPKEEKPSNAVARYLVAQGKEIIPVNPNYTEIMSLKCYPSLLDIPHEAAQRIEIVDVFRKPEEVPQVAKDAIELRKRNSNGKPLVFWMQLGIRNDGAAQELEKAGFAVVQDKCTKIELMRLSEKPSN